MWKSTFEPFGQQLTYKLFIWRKLFFSFWHIYLCVLDDSRENCWKFGGFAIVLSVQKCDVEKYIWANLMANNFLSIHLRKTLFSFWHTYLYILDDFRENCCEFGSFTMFFKWLKVSKMANLHVEKHIWAILTANNFQIIHLRETFFSFWHIYLCVLDDFRENCWKIGGFTIVLSD